MSKSRVCSFAVLFPDTSRAGPAREQTLVLSRTRRAHKLITLTTAAQNPCKSLNSLDNKNWLASSHGRGHRFKPCAVHHSKPCAFSDLQH